MIVKNKSKFFLIIISILLIQSCFGRSENLPSFMKYGNITGSVYNKDTDKPLQNVKLLIDIKGKIYTAETEKDGSFALNTGEISRGDGFTIHAVRDNFQNASRAVIFDLPNLRVDLGKISLQESTNASTEERKISGRMLKYDSTPLEGVIVSLQNSNRETIFCTSNANGDFELSGKYLYIGSSYNLTMSKTNHVTRTSTVAEISGITNSVNDTYLYKCSGKIKGNLLDDETGEKLPGASISATDSAGIIISSNTDSEGNFELKSDHFYLDSTYSVNLEKTNYISQSASVLISNTGDNIVPGSPIKLMINATISGTVISSSGGTISGISIEITDSNGTPLSTVSEANGSFTFSSTGFRKGVKYTLNFSHANFENKSITSEKIIEGINQLGNIIIAEKDYSYRITGKVTDVWDNSNISASISMIDDYGITRTATCNGSTGLFEISGIFIKGKEYNADISMTGYTGETEISGESIKINITETMTEQTSPQDIGTTSLYPIGICGNINNTNYKFTYSIKNSYEKFLTEKIGFTLSARNNSDINISSTFYLHIDDKENPLPLAPGNVYSSPIQINNSAKGVIIHGYEEEESVRPLAQKPSSFNIKNYTMYHFFVSDPGDLTIQTTGSTDTHLTLYYQNGSQLAVDDNSGSGSNAKINFNVNGTGKGWYFIKVKGSNDNVWGRYELSISGPEQNHITLGTWETDDIIISWYSNSDKTMYIAGKNESGSTGSIEITKMEKIGKIIRGSFSGTLRAITSTGATIQVNNGYFNIIRSE